ncbi:MAG: transcriptional regulator [Cytophagales bacterium]|nr:MAG: transcriptional regulator [Cytophagales bacterium]
MNIEEAKEQFIQIWGTWGTNWGINRTMAQIHALLLSSTEALCTEDIMQQLNISRSNANTNIHELLNWGLIFKEVKTGDRKEYFSAEKDIWQMSLKIIKERKKRELDNVQKNLQQITEKTTINKKSSNDLAFIQMVEEMEMLIQIINTFFSKIEQVDRTWIDKKLLKFLMS